MCVRIALAAAMLLPLVGIAQAAEIRVLAVRAPEAAIRTLAEEFARENNHQVVFTIDAPSVVMEKIKANEVHDLVIVSEPAMDQLDKEGLVNPESRVRLAKSTGTALPDTPAPETYEAALMSDGAAVEASRAFIKFLTDEEARPKWIAAGLQPVGDR